jgi:peptidyl-tRNA hydrolase
MMALDHCIQKLNLHWTWDNSLNGWTVEKSFENQSIIFFKTKDFMNLSGAGVRKATKKYGIPHAQVLVLHDDLERKLGRYHHLQEANSLSNCKVQQVDIMVC